MFIYFILICTLNIALGYGLAIYLGIPSRFAKNHVHAVATSNEAATVQASTEEEATPEGTAPKTDEKNDGSTKQATKASKTTDDATSKNAENEKAESADDDKVETSTKEQETTEASSDEKEEAGEEDVCNTPSQEMFQTVYDLASAANEIKTAVQEEAAFLWNPEFQPISETTATPEQKTSIRDLVKRFAGQQKTLQESQATSLNESSSQCEHKIRAEQESILERLAQTIHALDAWADKENNALESLQQIALKAFESAATLHDFLADTVAQASLEHGWKAAAAAADAPDASELLYEVDAFSEAFRSLIAAKENEIAPLAILLDVDRLERINKKHGPILGGSIVDIVEAKIDDALSDAKNISRLSGGLFCVVMDNVQPNQGTELIEHLREEIAACTVQSSLGETKLSVTCAIAEVQPDEKEGVTLTRLHEALTEAKRYGRNRTFLHEGKYPAPVVPIIVEIEPTVIALEEALTTA